jgi:hypothetical protein
MCKYFPFFFPLCSPCFVNISLHGRKVQRPNGFGVCLFGHHIPGFAHLFHKFHRIIEYSVLPQYSQCYVYKGTYSILYSMLNLKASFNKPRINILSSFLFSLLGVTLFILYTPLLFTSRQNQHLLV